METVLPAEKGIHDPWWATAIAIVFGFFVLPELHLLLERRTDTHRRRMVSEEKVRRAILWAAGPTPDDC